MATGAAAVRAAAAHLATNWVAGAVTETPVSEGETPVEGRPEAGRPAAGGATSVGGGKWRLDVVRPGSEETAAAHPPLFNDASGAEACGDESRRGLDDSRRGDDDRAAARPPLYDASGAAAWRDASARGRGDASSQSARASADGSGLGRDDVWSASTSAGPRASRQAEPRRVPAAEAAGLLHGHSELLDMASMAAAAWASTPDVAAPAVDSSVAPPQNEVPLQGEASPQDEAPPQVDVPLQEEAPPQDEAPPQEELTFQDGVLSQQVPPQEEVPAPLEHGSESDSLPPLDSDVVSGEMEPP